MTPSKLPLRGLLVCVAMVVLYAVVPVQPGDDTMHLVLRATGSVLLLLVLGLAIRWQAVRQIRDPHAPLGGLVIAVIAGVLVWALLDYAVEVHRPGEFSGLRTRVDALYLAISTLATVGFGDVSADGQLARGILCAQMAFNVTVIAGSASLVARKLTARTRRRRHDGDPPAVP